MDQANAGKSSTIGIMKMRTVEEEINHQIEAANHRIAHLMKLRDDARRAGVASMPQAQIAAFAFPGHENGVF